MGIPRLLVMALTRFSGPSLRAASILPTGPDMLCGGRGTNRSRGMDSREAVPLAGSRCSTIVTSLRAPPTLVEHGEGLADRRRRPEQDEQLAPVSRRLPRTLIALHQQP